MLLTVLPGVAFAESGMRLSAIDCEFIAGEQQETDGVLVRSVTAVAKIKIEGYAPSVIVAALYSANGELLGYTIDHSASVSVGADTTLTELVFANVPESQVEGICLKAFAVDSFDLMTPVGGTHLLAKPLDDSSLSALYGFDVRPHDTAVFNSVGGNGGSTVGTPKLTRGVAGTGLNFDGKSYVEVENQYNQSFTVSFWMKTDVPGRDGGMWYTATDIYDSGKGGNANDFGIGIRNKNIIFGVGNPDYSLTGKAEVVDGTWHHVVCTRDMATGTISIYVDGKLDAVSDRTDLNTLPLDSQSKICFGAGFDCGGTDGYYNGDLDEIRIYDGVLSQEAIADLAAVPAQTTFLAEPDGVMVAQSLSAFTVNSSDMLIKGNAQTMEYTQGAEPLTAKVNDNGTIMVPARYLAQIFGKYVSWQQTPSQFMSFDKIGRALTMEYDSNIIRVNGDDITASGVLEIGLRPGEPADCLTVVWVPAADVAEALGYKTRLVSDTLYIAPAQITDEVLSYRQNLQSDTWKSFDFSTLNDSEIQRTGPSAPTTGAGSLGTGLSFGGYTGQWSSQALYLNNLVVSSPSFSISFWVTTEQEGVGDGQWYTGIGLVDGEVGGLTDDFGVNLMNGGVVAFGEGQHDVGDRTVRSVTKVNDGKRHMVTAVKDADTGTIRLYVDGVLEAEQTDERYTAAKTATGSIAVGVAMDNPSGDVKKWFNGVIEGVTIYKEALTAETVAAIYR